MKKILYAIAAWSTVVFPAAVLAQTGEIPNTNLPKFESTVLSGNAGQVVVNLIARVANILAAVVLAVAVLMILVSAWNFITAQGDTEKLGTARRTLVYALVGVAVAFLAFTLPTLVGNFIGNK